jgi:hypothetical protein
MPPQQSDRPLDVFDYGFDFRTHGVTPLNTASEWMADVAVAPV